VLLAYEGACAVCRIRHDQLLDAAHILPDSDPRGEPWVSNGLSLCKIHHAAYDADILGISGDHKVWIRESVLEEEDGPMLLHGLKELNEKHLMVVPSQHEWRPNPDFLEERFQRFRRAG
jgi:putative restriction endonuclease